MPRFTLPRDIYFGENSLKILKTLRGKRAVIVAGGSSMKRFGFLDEVEGYLRDAGMETFIIDGVEPDPSVDTVLRGGRRMAEFEPDWIVAIGGGSPIDAAKAMWTFYEYPDVGFDELCKPFNFPELRKKARFCAIPSTSGTATEVTAFSVITDYAKGIKYPLADFNITPDLAILDPALAFTMPPALTAYTGMDALTHATEAYVSKCATAFSDPLAMKAIEMVTTNLPQSYLGDRHARAEMHIAQCLAGMAFSNALLGIVHSMAHKTGAVFSKGSMEKRHLTHGCANAIYLPYVIRYNSVENSALNRYADIARMLGLSGGSAEALMLALCRRIDSLNDIFSIPHTLREYGIDEGEFLEKLPAIAENAVGDACTGSNPRPIDSEKMAELFKCCYYGTPVNL